MYMSEEDRAEPLDLAQKIQDKVIEKNYTRRAKPFNQFSPSQTGYCKRQMYNRKMNLTKMPRKVQGILHAGTVNHFYLEHKLPEIIEDRALKTEQKIKSRIPTPEDFDIYISGLIDAVDSEGCIYDHKFTGNTYYVEDEPKEKDRRQVITYLYSMEKAHTGQLQYITRDGKFKEDEWVTHQVQFDEEAFVEMVDNMTEVAEKVREHDRKEIQYVNPFEKCGCYFCSEEEPREKVKEKRLKDDEHGWDNE